MHTIHKGPVERRTAGLDLYVKVTPGARHNAIGEVNDDGRGVRRLQVQVTAKADGGQANRAVLGLLAKSWAVPPSSLCVESGHTSRLKRVRFAVDEDKAAALLAILKAG